MKLAHWFLPHPETHQKAHLISLPGLASYIGLFIILQFVFSLIGQVKPGVLGVSSSINQQELVRLTNESRQNIGLPPLKEDARLNQAALEKAKNMFEENYWAHFSPSGKDPWGFILGAGYRFSFAGENLARNFYSSSDVVDAWMASPTHRENIVNSRYQNIGMAVAEGILNGQKTTLVVQEFATPVEAIAARPATVQGENIQPEPPVQIPTQQATIPVEVASSQVNQLITAKPTLDPYLLIKSLGLSVLALIGSLIVVDLIVMRRRGVVRLASRHWPHLALLMVAASTLFNLRAGQIL